MSKESNQDYQKSTQTFSTKFNGIKRRTLRLNLPKHLPRKQIQRPKIPSRPPPIPQTNPQSQNSRPPKTRPQKKTKQNYIIDNIRNRFTPRQNANIKNSKVNPQRRNKTRTKGIILKKRRHRRRTTNNSRKVKGTKYDIVDHLKRR